MDQVEIKCIISNKMGFLDKIFRKETQEEVKAQEKIEGMQGKGIDPDASLIENKILCNACGKEIENTPKFFNLQGRKMIFHKSCFRKLKNGNLQF